ncbi:hypothetical protein F5Y18DRAFT_102339 [Xylariaceae sp. FL1019]|nr:hypothetical protein F5Y18DRAFT_102339 [Xylariaceae sp. FL1019]
MPATRRSAGRPAAKQATLSFNHRVTKSVPKSGKDLSSTPVKQSPLSKHVTSADVKDEPDTDEDATTLQDLQPAAEPEAELEKTEAELRAEKISSKQVSSYWRKIESERRTKRVHQEELTLAEKILRYWDVSSQYGPCVGITRMKRWQRADKLGLNPPLEVLAVLKQEERNGTKGTKNAYMDDILNSTAVGAG